MIYGAGPFAKLMHYYFTHDSDYRVVPFTVDEQFIQKTEPSELQLVPLEEITATYPPDSVAQSLLLGRSLPRLDSVLCVASYGRVQAASGSHGGVRS